ncbi:MAG: DUF1513 domain-containing protein [Pseudomonadota bacterium]
MGDITFEIALPARGHAAAAHPILAQAVAFARRPGTFALVIDCVEGRQVARLNAPVGRHFYGHGTFSENGDLLFTTENDFENARGVVGVWDARRNFTRIAEFASGGVGSHDIKLMPDGQRLVVANGGIETHPETGRTKLNIPTMRSNLCFLDLDGSIRTHVELDAEHQRNSIRHLAIANEGTVAFGTQWQGDISDQVPVVGRYADNSGIAIYEASTSLGGYVGSIAITSSNHSISATSPRSGMALELLETTSMSAEEIILEDVCGVATFGNAFVYTTGTGLASERFHEIKWDNHLVKLGKEVCIKSVTQPRKIDVPRI